MIDWNRLVCYLSRSDSGHVLPGGYACNVPDPASSVGVPLVWPDVVPFMFCRAGAYGGCS